MTEGVIAAIGADRRPRLPVSLLVLCLFGFASVCSFAADVPDLPDEPFGPVQVRLETIIDGLELRSAVEDGRLSLALVTLDGREVTGLGMINGHRMQYAASLPKVAILYGAAAALDQGRVTLTDSLQSDLVAMIRHSCNDCANRVLAEVGRTWLLDLLQSEPYRFYDRERGGGLWVGKDYARKEAFSRDPLQGLSHAATAWQVARWYFLLSIGELASAAQTKLMLDCLSRPGISHKFVKGLADREATGLYRKSGTWRQYHSDSIMVTTEAGSYILVALAADQRGARWLEKIAPRVHDMVIQASGDPSESG